MMLKKVLLASGLLAILAVCAASPAHADTIYSLGTNTGLGCSPTCGTVDLAQDGTGVVLVTVNLNSPGVFVETGTHQDFDFNVAGTVAIGALSNGFMVDPGNPGTFTQPGLGTFIDSIDCNLGSSAACGSGGSSSTTSTFSFTVSQSGLTPASFTANGDGNFFSADILNSSTAAVGTTTSVPEPGTVALVGTGILALLGLGLRRKRIFA